LNAHLHSLWQAQDGWGSFHNLHIAHLVTTLLVQLRPLGYTASSESSLQIRRVGDLPRNPRADVLITDLNLPRTSVRAARPTNRQLTPILDLLEADEVDEKPYRAVVIYERGADGARGEPVAWLELLSPTNKGNTDDAEIYRRKRIGLMASGLVFIELDYLHATPPTFPALPTYRADKDGDWPPAARPYRITILDPRPSIEQGVAETLPFTVDEAIPTARIPLNGSDALLFDFGVPYAKTFDEGFLGDMVDYAALPAHFARYSPDDQIRIIARMVAVLEAAARGEDVEATAPSPPAFAPGEVALQAARERLRALGVEVSAG
jgi:hypothetical protein